MAWLQQDPSGNYHISFRFGGRKFKRSLRTKSERAAVTRQQRLEENIWLVESGRLEVPNGTDVPTFLMSDGKLQGNERLSGILHLGELAERFFASIDNGSFEASTLTGMQIHKRHLLRLLGKRLLLSEITLETLQGYVDARAREKGIRGGKVSPATIRKEITTLTCIWSWAQRTGTSRECFRSAGFATQRARRSHHSRRGVRSNGRSAVGD